MYIYIQLTIFRHHYCYFIHLSLSSYVPYFIFTKHSCFLTLFIKSLVLCYLCLPSSLLLYILLFPSLQGPVRKGIFQLNIRGKNSGCCLNQSDLLDFIAAPFISDPRTQCQFPLTKELKGHAIFQQGIDKCAHSLHMRSEELTWLNIQRLLYLINCLVIIYREE